MILDQLILHDFGQYRGRVAIALTPPSPDQPITLFGGLNGAGKTTLLDAIQLCLFGQFARTSRRDGQAYENYLLASIHRGSGASSASVELQFRHSSHGEEQLYHVKRSWKRTPKGCREQLEVIRNHRYDALATEHWAEEVEEFLPSRIAQLFLFDGEQVEGYADPRSSAALIETAVYNLLGLDLVEKLGSDLSVIERRRRMEARPASDRDKLIELERAHEEALERLQACSQEHARREAELSRVEAQRQALEDKYRKEGGHLYERRVQLEAQVRAAEQRFLQAERALADAAAGAAPLLLVHDLLKRVTIQSDLEQQSANTKVIDALLSERDGALLATLSGKDAALAASLGRYLDEDRQRRRSAIVAARLGLTESGRDRLREINQQELDEALLDCSALIAAYEQARTALDQAELQAAAVPTREALSELARERDKLIARSATLQSEQGAQTELLKRLRREAGKAEEEIIRFQNVDAEAQLSEDDRSRVLKHVARVRGTLDRFRDAVIRRHLERIEGLILDSLHQLLRKKTLIAGLRIVPDTFQLELTGRDGNALPAQRLSAGERQLLAVSILWGLARASGRPLPTVVDTPLGRLDSSHRRRLVSHYFPFASHQMILLSTDEEIAGGYFEALKPAVGRAYRLRFDEEEGATFVEPGYFSEAVYAD